MYHVLQKIAHPDDNNLASQRQKVSTTRVVVRVGWCLIDVKFLCVELMFTRKITTGCGGMWGWRCCPLLVGRVPFVGVLSCVEYAYICCVVPTRA